MQNALSTPSTALEHLRARFNVEHHDGLQECPNGGLVMDAARIDLGDVAVALALVADLAAVPGGRNPGLSITEAFPAIMSAYGSTLLDTLNVADILWVSRDTLGCFYRVRFEVCHGDIELTWQPLLSGLHHGGTEADFAAVFGRYAERAMDNVRTAVTTR